MYEYISLVKLSVKGYGLENLTVMNFFHIYLSPVLYLIKICNDAIIIAILWSITANNNKLTFGKEKTNKPTKISYNFNSSKDSKDIIHYKYFFFNYRDSTIGFK